MFANQVVKVIIAALKEEGSDVQIHQVLIASPLIHKIMATWCKLRVAVSFMSGLLRLKQATY
jgi:hypothetical protein